MSIKRNFVFLVFTRADVVGMFNFLQSVLQGRRVIQAPHLTIQGPFDEKVPIAEIAKIKRKLAGESFFIGNPGMFETPSGVALFIRVISPNLSRVWKKPDYPVEKFGFNPHITLYEGSDWNLAEKALRVLEKHRVEFVCDEFDVVQYVPKQMDLFPVDHSTEPADVLSAMVGQGRLSPNFRAAFMASVAERSSRA